MRIDELITVEGKAGRVIARVLELRAANEIPDLPIDWSDETRKSLADDFRSVAVMGYRFGAERIPVMFVLLEDEQGTWWDLKGHQLSIVSAGPASAAASGTRAGEPRSPMNPLCWEEGQNPGGGTPERVPLAAAEELPPGEPETMPVIREASPRRDGGE
jgi:hypothetical protein